MVASLQQEVKDIEHMKGDFEEMIIRLETNYKMINDNLIIQVNFSYMVIKSSVESVRVMMEKFERAWEAKSIFIGIDVVEKGKQVTQAEGRGPCTHTRVCSKKMVDQVVHDMRDMKKLSVNISQLEVEAVEAFNNFKLVVVSFSFLCVFLYFYVGWLPSS